MTTPTILAVTPIPPSTLRIEWSTGETLQINISEQIECFKLLHPLRDPERFAQAATGLLGHGVTWGCGIDMGAAHLYGLGCEQAGKALPVGFEALQQRMLADERERNICQRRREEKRNNWLHALGVWRTGGALHPFLLAQLAGLKDHDGDELPPEVGQFLLDLVQMKEPKPPQTRTGYVIPRQLVQDHYHVKLRYYRSLPEESDLLRGETPRDAAIEDTASDLLQKESWVASQMTTRKSRKKPEDS